MQDSNIQGVNFDDGVETMPYSSEPKTEQYLTPEEAQRQAGFDSLAETTSFAGDSTESNSSGSYSETQLDGQNIESDESFSADNEIGDADPVINEDEMNEQNFTDAELDNTRETLSDTLDYENANYGRSIVTKSLFGLNSLASRITRAGIIRPEQESEPGKLETQSNNLCKAACIYALNTKQIADNAIINFAHTSNQESASTALTEVKKYVELTKESAALATEQVKNVSDLMLSGHIIRRINQALEMANDAEARLQETISSGEAQIDKDQITDDATEENIDEDNVPRAISSFAARIDDFMEPDANEQNIAATEEAPENTEAIEAIPTDDSKDHSDDNLPNHLGLNETSTGNQELPNHLGLQPDATSTPAPDGAGYLTINQEPAEPSIIDAASDNINDPNYYRDKQGGEQGEY